MRAQANNTKHDREDSSDSDDGEIISKKTKRRNDDTGALQMDTLQAGKRFAVCDKLWVPPGAIQYLPLIANPPSEDDEPELADEQQMDVARAIFNSLAVPLRSYVGAKWFRTRVSNLIIGTLCFADRVFNIVLRWSPINQIQSSSHSCRPVPRLYRT